MRGTGHKTDRWLEKGRVVGITFTWQVLQRIQGSGLEQSQNYNAEGRKQPQFENSFEVAVSLGEGQTSEAGDRLALLMMGAELGW